MTTRNLNRIFLTCASLIVTTVLPVRAQSVETVGTRALGMGGAFVAVATDSSATWWNPAALATGPFLDLALASAVTETTGELPANRDRGGWFALGTPPFGFSYYRLRITEIQNPTSTVTESGSREDRRAGVTSLAASQLGITLVQGVLPGVHAGTTLKYVRGTVRGSVEDAALDSGDLLDRGEDLEGGDTDGAFDLDLGVIAVAGPLRLGLLVRNVLEPEFTSDAGVARMDRQVRVGAAYDGEAAGKSPLVIAIDADLRTTRDVSGERRNVAVGAERWWADRRIGLRAGARINTIGTHSRTATAGGSVALRSGLFAEGHVVHGGTDDDKGWGLGVRVSF